MTFIDNNTSSILFKNKHNHIVKSALICSAVLTGIMVANPLTKTTVKADTVTTTQIEAPATNWIATKPADIHVDNNQKTYTLNRGDTLWAIAQATKTDVNQLAQLNNINLKAGDQYHLAVGLTIKLTADAQTENNSNNNSSDNANTATQNSAISNNSNNTKSTTANNNSNAKTSPQSHSATTAAGSQAAKSSSKTDNTSKAGSGTNTDTTKNGQVNTGKSQVSKPADVIHNEHGAKASGKTNSQPAVSQSSALNNPGKSQAAKGSSKAGNTSNAGSGTNTDTTKNGQIDTGKSHVSKPADVIHNEHGAKASGKTNSRPAVSQSSALSDGSINSQTPSSSADKNHPNTPAAGSSQHSTPSSSANKTPNDNNGNTASSSANKSGSTPASSNGKTNSNSASNTGSGQANINHGAHNSSSNANSSSNSGNNSSNSSSNNNKASSSSKNNDSSSSSSSSSSDDNSQDTGNNSAYNQTAPLKNNDLAKVVALEKQRNDLQIQANTVSNNLQFYQDFIDATKNANGTNPQDRLDKIAFQNIYYQKTVDGWSDMSHEQAQLTTIKAQLPIDAQTITNLQNQLAKPDITNTEKQTLKTDLNNAKATAVKDQETYQTLQAKINQANEIVAQYKDFLARNANMTAALKGNGQANSLVTQYQKYINDNQNTQASLDAHIADINHQLKAYGVTLNS